MRNLPGFAGPLDAQVSDDGRLLASWGILEQLDHVDPFAIPPAPKYFVAQFNAPNVTDCCHNADITASLDTGGLAWPSWLHDGTFIAAPFSNLLKGYGIWYVPPRHPRAALLVRADQQRAAPRPSGGHAPRRPHRRHHRHP